MGTRTTTLVVVKFELSPPLTHTHTIFDNRNIVMPVTPTPFVIYCLNLVGLYTRFERCRIQESQLWMAQFLVHSTDSIWQQKHYDRYNVSTFGDISIILCKSAHEVEKLCCVQKTQLWMQCCSYFPLMYLAIKTLSSL